MEKRYDNISKIRLLKVWEILRTETDEDNPMGTPILLQKLANQGIKCDRRTVYRDIQLLNDFGYEILHNRGISNYILSLTVVLMFQSCAFCWMLCKRRLS